MAIFKCKMCGANLEVQEGQKTITCEFCDTTQTLPNLDDERKINLFKRANTLRSKCEFDKAYGVYETIASEFKEEAEAYWGLVLCKYGIEYVDDPKTLKKIPTCHRTEFTSIFDDSDYQNTLKFADVVARDIYEKEAKEIDRLQKEIINLSNKEEPYDIFICYKESESNGDRTLDSVLAFDIYKALTKEGYKVFFSRVTLENMLGSQYEPKIFAALHSAKVMLHVTTNEEHTESVWVKNEWSRYLAIMRKDDSKVFIPLYKEISPYDLPQELQSFQGQDMSKIGAMQDLIHGLSKILTKEKASQNTESLSISNTRFDPDTGDEESDALVRKGFAFLRNNKLDKARTAFEEANEIVDSYSAYIGIFALNNNLSCGSPIDIEKQIPNLDSEYFIQEDFVDVISYAKANKDLLSSYRENALNKIMEYYSKAMEKHSVEGYKHAIKLLDKCPNAFENPDLSKENTYLCLARALSEEKRYNEAIKIIERECPDKEKSLSVYEECCYQYALSLKEHHELDEACNVLEKVYESSDKCYELLSDIQMYQIDEKHYNDAVKTYQRIVDGADPKYAAGKFQEILDLRKCLYDIRNFSDAEEYLDKTDELIAKIKRAYPGIKPLAYGGFVVPPSKGRLVTSRIFFGLVMLLFFILAIFDFTLSNNICRPGDYYCGLPKGLAIAAGIIGIIQIILMLPMLLRKKRTGFGFIVPIFILNFTKVILEISFYASSNTAAVRITLPILVLLLSMLFIIIGKKIKTKFVKKYYEFIKSC